MLCAGQAWQPKEGGLLATGGEDGKVLIYNVLDAIEGAPYMCVPCACAELPEEGVTQIAWGSDNQLYTGHTSGMADTFHKEVICFFSLASYVQSLVIAF